MIIRDFMAGKSGMIIVVNKFRAIIHNSVLQVPHDDACSDKHIPSDLLVLRTAKHAVLRNTRTTFSARQLEKARAVDSTWNTSDVRQKPATLLLLLK